MGISRVNVALPFVNVAKPLFRRVSSGPMRTSPKTYVAYLTGRLARLRRYVSRLVTLATGHYLCLTGEPHCCDGWPNEIWSCPVNQARVELRAEELAYQTAQMDKEER